MINLFRNFTFFSVVYFVVVLICLFLRLLTFDTSYSYIFRPLTLMLLLIYFITNNNYVIKKRRIYIFIILLFFILGEIFFAYEERIGLSKTGILLYVVGKLFYCASFSNDREFNSKIFKKFLIIIFILITTVMSLVLSRLGDFLIPVLMYLLASVFMTQYGLMRKDEVNDKSFKLVVIGVSTFILVDFLTALKYFYLNNQYIDQSILIFIYALSQYLIITGLVHEQIEENVDRDIII